MYAVPETVEQVAQQAQPGREAGDALHARGRAQQQHRGAHVLAAAKNGVGLLGYFAPLGLDGGDHRVAELLLGLALRGRDERGEVRVVLQVVAAWRCFADGREQCGGKFVVQHVAC